MSYMYVLDSNIFIEGQNRYYSFDVAPGFWDWIERAYSKKIICSIEPVLNELQEKQDELASWAHQHRNIFQPIDNKTVRFFTPLSDWAYNQNFTDEALESFTGSGADFQLVAFASAHNCTVVTQEMSNPQSRKRVMIPDACDALGVNYLNCLSMLKEQKVRLVYDGCCA